MSLSESEKAPGCHAGKSRSRFTAQDFSGGDSIENFACCGSICAQQLGPVGVDADAFNLVRAWCFATISNSQ